MHTMPKPVVHRDIKSMNIMVMQDQDGISGKLGDCGESRRVDLNSTMTSTGSPLWAAPELLAGKRYCEDVDTYALGIVMLEVATRQLPYAQARKAFAKSGGKGVNPTMMQEIAKGYRKPQLDPLACKRHRVGGTLKQLFRHCTKFEPRERPEINDVVRRLELVCETVREVKERPRAALMPKVESGKRIVAANAWAAGSPVAAALERFASRLEDSKHRAQLEALTEEVKNILGPDAINAVKGVYNPAKLYRALRAAGMDVSDAKAHVVVNANARDEFKMDAKRALIVREGLTFDTLPRHQELRTYQPGNLFMGRSKAGEVIVYHHLGAGADFAGSRKAFSIEEYVETVLFCMELQRIMLDALCAAEGRDVHFIVFYDMNGISFGDFLCHLEYFKEAGAAMKRAVLKTAGTERFMVNCPSMMKMGANMLVHGIGLSFGFTLFEPGRDLRQEDAVTSLVDVALLPKAIGGDASSIAENGEEDERCVRGFKFPSVNDYVACLECLK